MSLSRGDTNIHTHTHTHTLGLEQKASITNTGPSSLCQVSPTFYMQLIDTSRRPQIRISRKCYVINFIIFLLSKVRIPRTKIKLKLEQTL